MHDKQNNIFRSIDVANVRRWEEGGGRGAGRILYHFVLDTILFRPECSPSELRAYSNEKKEEIRDLPYLNTVLSRYWTISE